MKTAVLIWWSVIAVISAGSANSVEAHDHERSHVHVGGGIAYRPWTFTLQSWYRDIVYDERAPDTQFTSLDVYTPQPEITGAPVMVFVHGGGFRVGDKASSKDLGPKPEYFTSKLGFIFISVNYRLLPEGRYPQNVRDVANALAWVHNNIDQLGGDPDKIFLMGHSAGAVLVAQVATDETFLMEADEDLTLLKGVIANEGSYGAGTGEEAISRMKGLFGENWREIVPLAHAEPGKGIPPFMVIHVTGEDTRIAGSEGEALALAGALRDADVRAEVLSLNHVEHFGANEQIGIPGDITTVSIERFLDSITKRKNPAQWTSARPSQPSE